MGISADFSVSFRLRPDLDIRLISREARAVRPFVSEDDAVLGRLHPSVQAALAAHDLSPAQIAAWSRYQGLTWAIAQEAQVPRQGSPAGDARGTIDVLKRKLVALTNDPVFSSLFLRDIT
jgi:hypothetical protein